MRAGYLIGIVLEMRVDVEQSVHRLWNVFGQGHARRRGHVADDVGLRLVSSDVVYGFVGLSCAVLEYGVQVADEVLVHGLVGVVEDPAVCFGVRVDPSMWLEFHANCSWVST